MLKGRPLEDRERTATFTFADPETVEDEWNTWVMELFAAGLRPADCAFRWTDNSATYRLFPVDAPDPAAELVAVGMEAAE